MINWQLLKYAYEENKLYELKEEVLNSDNSIELLMSKAKIIPKKESLPMNIQMAINGIN